MIVTVRGILSDLLAELWDTLHHYRHPRPTVVPAHRSVREWDIHSCPTCGTVLLIQPKTEDISAAEYAEKVVFHTCGTPA